VFTALQNGQAMPSLAPALQAWVEDDKLASHHRVDAYGAWKRCTGFSTETALGWLQAIHSDDLADNDDELCGVLLSDLYPQPIQPDAVFEYWHPPKHPHLIGTHRRFWKQALWSQTPSTGFAALADGWLKTQERLTVADSMDRQKEQMAARVLAEALKHQGDSVSDQTLFEWLGIGLDERGSSRLEREERETVRQWLSARPNRMKAVAAISLSRTKADQQGRWHFWQSHERLHGAPYPRDWLFWLVFVFPKQPKLQ
jgi:hypothetical protein